MRPVRLITSKALSQDEVIALLLKIGVKRNEGPNHVWGYEIRSGEAIVWMEPDDPENYPEPEVDAIIESKLNAPAQTSLVLNISRNPGSEQVARDLAIRFAEQVPAVLDNLSGLARRIFTLAELQALQAKDAGLWDDAKGIPLPREWRRPSDEERAQWEREWAEERRSKSSFEKERRD